MTLPRTYEERISGLLADLGIPATYGRDRHMPLCPEADELASVGADVYGREQFLAPHAAAAWRALQAAALDGGLTLLLVSAFRSVAYQQNIIQGKLRDGQPLDDVLRVNAAPGYSEHHTGRAVDLTTPGCPPLTEGFDRLVAFAWLTAHAADFGFLMTYPRGNPQSMIYEPWHWLWVEKKPL